MEENKNQSNVKETTKVDAQKKVSYEQLSAYASQLQEQAKKIFQENQILKQAINSRDMEFAFRCLDHAELFSKEFIQEVVKRIEELMNPGKQEKENNEEKPNIERKE